VIGLPWDGR